jgi:hypothetical protein
MTRRTHRKADSSDSVSKGLGPLVTSRDGGLRSDLWSLGNRNVAAILQREPAAGTSIFDLPPHLRLDPLQSWELSEKQRAPIYAWLDSNAKPMRTVSQLVRDCYRVSEEARKAGPTEVRFAVETWVKRTGYKVAMIPLFEDALGLDAVLSVSAVPTSSEGKGEKRKITSKGDLTSEIESPISSRLTFEAGQKIVTEDGKQEYTAAASLDLLPESVEKLMKAAKVKLNIGTLMLKLGAGVQAEIKASVDGFRERQSSVSAGLNAEAEAKAVIKLLYIPVYLQSSVKASTEKGGKVEFTPLKFAVEF